MRGSLRARTGKCILLINTPHNPSGYVFTPEDWQQIIRIKEKTDCVIVLDDVYRDFNFTTHPVPYASLANCNMLIAGSISKSLTATGVRIGWLIGEKEAMARAQYAHSHLSYCQPALLQTASLRLLQSIDDKERIKVPHLYHDKAQQLCDALVSAGFDIIQPNGAHFIMAHHAGLPGIKSLQKSLFLSRHFRVTLLPLNSFFMADTVAWLRFSFAINEKTLAVACQRLKSTRLSG